MYWYLVLVILSFASAVVSAQTAYTIDTVAGTSWVGDGGQARSALLLQPEGIAIDTNGVIYLSDAGDHRIRRIRLDGTIETLAGTGFPGQAANELNAPYGISLDRQGNLFIADLGNARVRRLSADGQLTTVAGGGTSEPQLNSRLLATTVRLREPRNVALDGQGNLYISDFAAHTVYKVDQQGYLTPFAGTGESGSSGDGGGASKAKLSYPAGLALDSSGTLYIADSGNRRVRKVTNNLISSVLDKTRKPAEFGVPTGLAIDAAQTLYVADRSEVTTLIRPDGATITMPLGGGEVAVDSYNRLYTTGPKLLKRYDGRLATVVAGNSFGLYAGDGRPAAEWRFNGPNGMAQDSRGNLYIADSANGRIRQITPAGELRSLAFGFVSPTGIGIDSLDRVVFTDSKAGTLVRLDAAGKPATLASNLKQPAGLAIDKLDSIYVGDAGTNLIRRFTPDGASAVIAGAGYNDGDGPALECRLQQPYGIALDGKGGLIFSEAGSGRIRRLDLASFRITTLRKTDLMEPRGLAAAGDGSIYFADSKLNRILQLTLDGTLRPVAGSGEQAFEGDGGPALAASFRIPFGILITENSILVADTGNGRVRRLQRQAGQVGEIVAPPTTTVPAALPGKLTVQHAALNRPAPVAPGQLISIITENLSPEPDWQMTVNGTPVTVLQWKPAILATVPSGVKLGTATLSLNSAGTSKASASAEIVTSAPALFGENGMAMAVNQDGSINSLSNASPRGSVIALYLTGVGNDPGLISAMAGQLPANVWYAGDAPGMPGIYQINIELPSGFAPPGLIPVSVSIGGATTPEGMRVATR